MIDYHIIDDDEMIEKTIKLLSWSMQDHPYRTSRGAHCS